MKRHSSHRRPSKSPAQSTRHLMVASREEIMAMPPRIVRELVHELRIHQIELELQNEELRQAQLELAESRDRYCDLYEFAPIGYVTLDKQKRIVESNFTAASLLGVERVHLVGQDISHFVARESRDNCYLHLQAALESGRKQTCELEMCTKNGAVLIVRMESTAEQIATAGVQFRTALIDVTEARLARKQLQQFNEQLGRRIDTATADLQRRTEQVAEQSVELARGERHFRTLVDNVPALFSYVDLDQRYRYVNHEYEKVWGRPAFEIVGTTVADLLGPRNYDAVRPHIESVFRGKETVAEVEIEHPDGWRTMQVRAMPDRDGNGVCGFFTLATDITDRKQAEAELQQYRKNLQVASSELMLAEEHERRRLAEDLHDNLGQAVFRAIMTLNHPPFDDGTVRELRKILMDISKVVGTLTYKLSPVMLRQAGLWPALRWLAKDIKQRYGLHVRLKGEDRDVSLEERVSTVLFRSIREMLVNVAKHAETGFAAVSIREKSQTLVVSVRDRGKGFEPDDKFDQKLGKHFGLFSVRERLEYIGGSFKIQSAPGAGTTVTLTVPLKV